MAAVVEQMRQFGAGAEVIAKWEAAQQADNEIEVLECNEQTVQIYTRCALGYVGGMAVVCIGISMQEIRAALTVYRVARADWAGIADGVMHMAAVAAKNLNRAAAR